MLFSISVFLLCTISKYKLNNCQPTAEDSTIIEKTGKEEIIYGTTGMGEAISRRKEKAIIYQVETIT
jgi:hypothetical protein